jgi:tetratricopeptide (TPR) repeat protein
MSKTLYLATQLLLQGRQLQKLGRLLDATRLLRRLAEFRELPDEIAAETHVCLAELFFRQRRWRRARGHLNRALEISPDDARAHYLMGRALLCGSRPDRCSALQHYRRSLELQPLQPMAQVACGLLLVRLGWNRQAASALREAVRLAPDESVILAAVVRGLCRIQLSDEARSLLLAARFRHPHDRRFLALADRLRFDQVRRAQQTARDEKALQSVNGVPVLLPFCLPRPAGSTESGRKIVRPDSATPARGPRGVLKVRRPDQRHAQ